MLDFLDNYLRQLPLTILDSYLKHFWLTILDDIKQMSLSFLDSYFLS